MSGQANLGPYADTELDGGVYVIHPTIVRALRDRMELHERRTRRTDLVLQVSIAILTLAAVGLLAVPGEYSRWGYVLGLASQPFYIMAAHRARQWGMYFVGWVLCCQWTFGIATHFF